MTYEHTGHDEDARKSYEDVIKLQPDNVEALNNLAYLKADGGVDLDQALAYAKQAQLKRPNDPSVIDTVALIYIRKNLTDDSLRLLRDLVSQEAGQSDVPSASGDGAVSERRSSHGQERTANRAAEQTQ